MSGDPPPNHLVPFDDCGAWLVHSPEALRRKVFAVEEWMAAYPQVECPIKHHFSFGLYGREAIIPKGTILTGHIHKHPQLNVLLSGEMSVLIDGSIKRIKAPKIICAPAGTKRIAYAHEESIWLTVLATELTDVEAIMDRLIAKTEDEYIAHVEQDRMKCLT